MPIHDIFIFHALAVGKEPTRFNVRAATEDQARTKARHWVINHCDCSVNWLIELVGTLDRHDLHRVEG